MRGPARHARLLGDGTVLLLRRYRGWLLPGELQAAFMRVAGCLFWGGLAYTILERARILMWPLAAWGLVAAWRAGRAVERLRAFDARFLQLLTDAMDGANGVLLGDLLDACHRHGLLEGWSIADLRSTCERLGVRVRASLSVGGRVSVGVHRDDLEAAYSILSVDQQPLPHRGDPLSGEPSSAGDEPTSPLDRIDLIPGGVDSWPMQPPPDRGLDAHIDDALDLFRKDPQ